MGLSLFRSLSLSPLFLYFLSRPPTVICDSVQKLAFYLSFNGYIYNTV